jgi:hypothetical protein
MPSGLGPTTAFDSLWRVTSLPIDPNVLRGTQGYLVADMRGRVLGRVERAAIPEEEQANARLWVRGRLPMRRRRVIPVSAVEEIDETSRVVVLRVERGAI